MDTEQIETGTFERWSPDEVETGLEKGEIVVIDVRSPQEYAFEHIEGALLMPMPFFRADRLPTTRRCRASRARPRAPPPTSARTAG